MVRLSHFAADIADEIAEIDLNPVIVHARGQGVSIVDALIVQTNRHAKFCAAPRNNGDNVMGPFTDIAVEKTSHVA